MSPEYDSVQLSLVVERQCQAAVAIAVNVNLVRPVMNAMKYTSSVHRFSDRTGLPHPRATSDISKYYVQLRCSSVENLSMLFLRFAASGLRLAHSKWDAIWSMTIGAGRSHRRKERCRGNQSSDLRWSAGLPFPLGAHTCSELRITNYPESQH